MAGACAYCYEALRSTYDRCYCVECCSGPAATFWACAFCAEQRSSAAGAPAKRQRRLEEAEAEDSSQPCFDPGHRFAQVVPEGSSWLTLPPGPEAGKLRRLRQFVRDYRPAQAPPSLAWISVSSGTRECIQPAEAGQQAAASQHEAAGAGQGVSLAALEAMRAQSYEERHKGALQDWEIDCQLGSSNAETAQQIGRQRGITTGKWMLYTSTDAEDEVVWTAVARAVYVDGLCLSAKITAGPVPAGTRRVICVYTADFDDREDAMRVHAGLSSAPRAAMPERDKWPALHYKPDIYTSLGIYSGNAWKIKPTIYSAKL